MPFQIQAFTKKEMASVSILYFNAVRDYCEREKNLPHPETMIGAAAALTGVSALYAISEGKVPQGAWAVYGDAMDKFLYKSGDGIPATVFEMLIMVPASRREFEGAKPPKWVDVRQKQMDQMGSAFYPFLSVEPKHYPLEWSPKIVAAHFHNARDIAEGFALTAKEMTFCFAVATGMLLSTFAKEVPMETGFRLATDIITGCSMLSPWSDEAELSPKMSFDPSRTEERKTVKLWHYET